MSTSRDQIDNTTRSDLHNSRGIELASRGWLDEAVSEFNKAILNAPNSAQGYDNLGTVYADKGDFLAALTSYSKALSLEPDNPYSLHNLGCFLSNHASKLSTTCFRAAFKIEPDFYEARFNLGLCLAGEDKHEAALAHFEKALILSESDPEVRYHLSLSLIALGHNLRALKELKIIVKDNPKHDDAWLRLGTCYIKQGFLGEAEQALSKAIRLNAKNLEAILTLASLLQQQKRSHEAKDLVKLAMKIDASHSEDFISDDEFLGKLF